ncbi:hypothetical protein PGT21_002223 [Puccinia graminis f. sp. tritici]|uniref:Uncharacterized protein n=1 Tax=Puccinia graminis f. sp. tritici TaxID=56615 RepID=A0A5B0QTD1_PUCGR|nr:hypothetical protein PGT21_002223 [Puccinia graminis f. sp. tritici]
MVPSAAEKQATRMSQVYPHSGQDPRGSHLQRDLEFGAPYPWPLTGSKNPQFVGKHAAERPVLPNRHFMLKTPKRNKQPNLNQVKGICSLTICRSTFLPPAREEPGDLYRYYYYSARKDGEKACLLFKALIMRGNYEAVLRVESRNLRAVRLKLWFPYRKRYLSEMDLDPGQSLRLSIPTDPGWPRQNAPQLHFMGFKQESVAPESSQDVLKRMHSSTLNLNASPWQSPSQPIEHRLASTSSYHNPPVQASNASTELIKPFQSTHLEHSVSFLPSSSDFANLSGFASTVLPESVQLVRTSGISEDDRLGFVTPLTFDFLDSLSGSELDQVHGE